MTKPFEPTKDFTMVHNALFQLYTKLDDFKGDHIAMYMVLMSYYNEREGYAYPTKADLALRLNYGINKPAQLAKVLEKYGLIKCVSRKNGSFGSNDIYYVYAPITDAQEFSAKYAEQVEAYEEKATKMYERNIKKPKKDEAEYAEITEGDRGMTGVTKEYFENWKALDLYHHAEVFTIADCQNFYNESGEVIARHGFGGFPNIYEIREDYFSKEDEAETLVNDELTAWL
ncbi:hypothetical protein [Bacillus sp. JJ722]|uniref:hypothetical protein n=1 Tax=Bacillus sp. JJ722 TaxID=3122973 RepID=UPI0030000066